MLLTRRALLAAITAPAVASKPHRSVYRGVELGAQSFSFKDRDLNAMLDACEASGVYSVELWSGHIEPKRDRSPGGRERLRTWRIREGESVCTETLGRFQRRGIRLNAFNLSLRNDATDEEIDAAFRMTRALGCDILTSSSNVSTAPRIDPFAKRHKVRVGFHNHARIKEDEIATPEDFRRLTEGFSEYLGINLDTGHFHAAGFDNLDFMRRNHSKLTTLHMKDRKSNDGDKVPFGKGDTPLTEILHLLRDNRWSVPANIEMAYPNEDPVREVRESMDYMKRALDG